MSENIIYDVTGKVHSDLPKNKKEKNYIFEFIGLDTGEWEIPQKTFKFKATLTKQKKEQLIGIIISDNDSSNTTFEWENIEWHFDYLISEYRKIDVQTGRIYFVRKNDDEIITPDNYKEKTKYFKKVKTNNLIPCKIVNEAIKTYCATLRKIDEIKSQS